MRAAPALVAIGLAVAAAVGGSGKAVDGGGLTLGPPKLVGTIPPGWNTTTSGTSHTYRSRPQSQKDTMLTATWKLPATVPAGGAKGSLTVTAVGGDLDGDSIGISVSSDDNRALIRCTGIKDSPSYGSGCRDGDRASANVSVQPNESKSATQEFLIVPGGGGTVTISLPLGQKVVYTYTAGPLAPVKATFGSLHGDVSISRNGGSFVDADSGEQLRAGDEISTGPDSGAVLRFPDGSTITVEANTQISIGSLIAQKDDVKVRMNLKFGKVAAKVNKSEAAVSDYSVQTTFGGGSSRGTAFSVFHGRGTKAAAFAVTQGAIYVRPARPSLAPALVVAGAGVTVTKTALTATGAPVRTRQRALAVVKVAVRETARSCKTRVVRFSATGRGTSWTVRFDVQLAGKTGQALFAITNSVLRPANALAKRIAAGC